MEFSPVRIPPTHNARATDGTGGKIGRGHPKPFGARVFSDCYSKMNY